MDNFNEKQINCSVNLNLGIDVRFMDSKLFPNGWKSHWHDIMELIYVKSGSLSAKINDLPNTTNVYKNQLIVIPPKFLHELGTSAGNFEVISIFLDLPSLTNQTFF